MTPATVKRSDASVLEHVRKSQAPAADRAEDDAGLDRPQDALAGASGSLVGGDGVHELQAARRLEEVVEVLDGAHAVDDAGVEGGHFPQVTVSLPVSRDRPDDEADRHEEGGNDDDLGHAALLVDVLLIERPEPRLC